MKIYKKNIQAYNILSQMNKMKEEMNKTKKEIDKMKKSHHWRELYYYLL